MKYFKDGDVSIHIFGSILAFVNEKADSYIDIRADFKESAGIGQFWIRPLELTVITELEDEIDPINMQ